MLNFGQQGNQWRIPRGALKKCSITLLLYCHFFLLFILFLQHSDTHRLLSPVSIINHRCSGFGLLVKDGKKRNARAQKNGIMSRRLPLRMPLMFFPTNWCQTSYCATWTPFGIPFARGSATGGTFSWQAALLQLLLLSASLPPCLLVEAI